MKSRRKVFAAVLILLSFVLFAGISMAQEAFQKHVVKADESLLSIAKKYFEDKTLWPEFLRFNNILPSALEGPGPVGAGDVLTVPTADVLRMMKKAKSESEKLGIAEKFKKFKDSDMIVRINQLREKLKQFGIAEKIEKNAVEIKNKK